MFSSSFTVFSAFFAFCSVSVTSSSAALLLGASLSALSVLPLAFLLSLFVSAVLLLLCVFAAALLPVL